MFHLFIYLKKNNLKMVVFQKIEMHSLGAFLLLMLLCVADICCQHPDCCESIF